MVGNNLIDGIDVIGLAEFCHCCRVQDIAVKTELATPGSWNSNYKYKVKFTIYLVGIGVGEKPLVSDPDCTLIEREENFSDSSWNVKMNAKTAILSPGDPASEKNSKLGVDYGKVRPVELDHPMGWGANSDGPNNNRTMHLGVKITVSGGEGCGGSKSVSVETWLRVVGGKPDKNFERITVSYE